MSLGITQHEPPPTLPPPSQIYLFDGVSQNVLSIQQHAGRFEKYLFVEYIGNLTIPVLIFHTLRQFDQILFFFSVGGGGGGGSGS